MTHRDSCDSPERLADSLRVLYQALSTRKIDLLMIRINPNPDVEDRVLQLTRQCVEWSREFGCVVQLSSDWVTLWEASGAHGVHVKEFQRAEVIPSLQRASCLVGTSCHSLESAIEAVEQYRVDYLLVGTCYPTESHPEKTEVEGPSLPGEIRAYLREHYGASAPPVLAIGGLDETNAHVPRADGVAVIRAILDAPDPVAAVHRLQSSILQQQ